MYQDPEMNTRRTGGAKREHLPLFDQVLPPVESLSVFRPNDVAFHHVVRWPDQPNINVPVLGAHNQMAIPQEAIQDGERHSEGSELDHSSERNGNEPPRRAHETPEITTLVQPEGPSRWDEASPAKIRSRKRREIVEFFLANLGVKFGTSMLHDRFGTAFRSRKSEINRDEACPIVIKQTGKVQGDKEISHYWSERRMK